MEYYRFIGSRLAKICVPEAIESVKIIEAQVGSILKETDIVRYQDVYGRVK